MNTVAYHTKSTNLVLCHAIARKHVSSIVVSFLLLFDELELRAVSVIVIHCVNINN